MEMINEVRILHLSDLHFGENSRFSSYMEDNSCEELGRQLHACVKTELKRLALQNEIHAVITTGDISQSADESEYRHALNFFQGISGGFGLPREKFVFSPGNHDISWQACRIIEGIAKYDKWPHDKYLEELNKKKLERFRDFLKEFYGKENPLPFIALTNDSVVYEWPELGLSVASLNSCEKESHKDADHVGHIGMDQLVALKRHWSGHDGTVCRIVALHHNPFPNFESVAEQWKKDLAKAGRKKNVDSQLWQNFLADASGLTDGKEELKRLCSQVKVTLLLSGHYHKSQEEHWSWTDGEPGHTILACAGSMGLEKASLPWEQPNVIHLLRMQTEPKHLFIHPLLYNPHGHTPGKLGKGGFFPDGSCLDGRCQEHCCQMARATRAPRRDDKIFQFLNEFKIRFRPLYKTWENQAVGSLRDGERMRGTELDGVFVQLRLGNGYDITDLNRGKVISPEEIIYMEEPLAIRGQAGTGKTTWMRWTFRRLLERDDALPLMVELRRLAAVFKDKQGAERSFDAYLQHWLGQQMGEGWETTFSDFLKKPPDGIKPVILVDGWDELGAMGGELRDKLLGFLASHKKVGIVVSSRPQSENHPEFETLDIQPLSDREQDELANAFYQEYFGLDDPEANTNLNKLKDSLIKSSEAKTLARIPILFTMLMAVSLDEKLPEKRHKLYQKCLELMIRKMPLQKEQEGAVPANDQWAPDDEDERWRATAAMALAMMQNKAEGGGRKEIVLDRDRLGDRLPQEWKSQQKRWFINWMQARTGLLVEEGNNGLSFVHLSFQEYLAAWKMDADAISDQERNERFARLATNYQWWETLRLWGAMTDAKSPGRFGTLFKKLCKNDEHGYWLAGALLSDDLGDEELFTIWCKNLNLIHHHKGLDNPLRCATSWAVSDNERRKKLISHAIISISNHVNWLDYAALNDWTESAGLGRLPEPVFGPARLVLDAIEQRNTLAATVARGRSFCCCNVLFPMPRWNLVFLRLWPGSRPLWGYLLQWWANLVQTRQELVLLLKHALTFKKNITVFDSSKTREKCFPFAIDFVHDFYYDFYRYLSSDLFKELSSRPSRYLSRYFYGDYSSYFYRDFSRDFSNYLSNDLSRYFGQFLRGNLSASFSRYSYQDHHGDSVANFSRYFYRDVSNDFYRDFYRSFYRDFYRGLRHMDLSAIFGDITKKLTEFDTFLLADAFSSNPYMFGLIGPRSVLAMLLDITEYLSPGLLKAFCEACSCSLGRGSIDAVKKTLNSISNEHQAYHALARHIAGGSSLEDRKLLESAVQHPENVAKDDKELLWGLQYYVRGDIMFLDGSTVRLDDILESAGIEPPPILVDMAS